MTEQATRLTFILLAGANFSVALGYGVVLPFVPLLVEHVAGPTPMGTHAFHIGALLGIYPLTLFLAAPLWGRVADRGGGRRIALVGLGFYALALVAFAFSESMRQAYVLRIAAGVAAAAVLPVIAATVGQVIDLRRRARIVAGMSAASLVGLLAGPALSGWAYMATAPSNAVAQWAPAVVWPPLGASAVLVTFVLFGIARRLPRAALDVAARQKQEPIGWYAATPVLFANFAVLLGLGAFEAVLPLLGKTQLPFDTAVLGFLLAECMLVMLAVQLALFATPILHRNLSGGLIVSGYLGMAVGVVALSMATAMWAAVAAVAVIAACATFLQTAIAYTATLSEGGASAALLGALAGLGSLGQASGSFLGGALFAALDMRVLWLVAGLLLITAVACGVFRERDRYATKG